MEVERIDPNDPDAFDAWFAVLRQGDLERWPDRPGWQHAERLVRALDQEGPEEHQCLVARGGDGGVLGVADLETFRRENRHLARLQVYVLPEARRHGVGSALVWTASDMARQTGRTELGGMDETPRRTGYIDAAAGFARRLGFSPAQHMIKREQKLPLSPSRRRTLGQADTARPAGYSILTFIDRWPEEYVADRCEMGRRMSTDVPMGEQVLDEEMWDETRVRQIEASVAAQNRAKVITAARHDASGRLVAFTEVDVPLGAPRSAWQQDTLVLREHRGHGLGLAVKVANALAVQERHPEVRSIGTWNAEENAHMIAVNEELGYEVTATSTYWLKKIEPG
jgi:GNAT superfamily N-acetyltransferase